MIAPVRNRPTKFCAALLAASLGASGVVASFAACRREAREARAEVARHDCCHAQRARADRRDAGTPHARHASAHADLRVGPGVSPRRSHEAGRAPHDAEGSARVGPQDDSGAPCADCCAPPFAVANSLALTPARGAGRADGAPPATAPQPPPPAPALRRELHPTQHAPPAPRARLHARNGVLLI